MTSAASAAVIVMAAGRGTRMRSVIPKVLHRIGDRNLVGHAVTAARGLEPQHLVVVVRHERDAVITHLAGVVPDAVSAEQDEVPGTGRAVVCGLAALPEDLTGPIVVTSGDVPLLDTATLRGFLAQHHERGDAAIPLTTELEDPTGYGRVVCEADGTVSAVVEQCDASGVQRVIYGINAGVYVFDAAHLCIALVTLDTDSDQGEVCPTDIVAHTHRAGRSTSALVVTDHWLVEGCNDRTQFAELDAELNRRVLAGWMAQGAGVVDPAFTQVDVIAELAQDITLEQGVLVCGTTRIGQGARAGAYAIFADAAISAGCVVAPFNQLDADAVQV